MPANSIDPKELSRTMACGHAHNPPRERFRSTVDRLFHRGCGVLAAACLLCGAMTGQDLSTIGSERPFAVSGAVRLSGQHYSSSTGNTTGRPDATGNLYLSSTITLYGVQIPLGLYLTTSEVTYRQPFNEFGISPRYKGITGHFGYRSVSYSPLTLASQRWLGAGLDCRFPGVRLSAMYGRFQKAAEEDSARRLPAIYNRMGYGLKIGFGTDRSYIDANYFRAWDDSASVSRASPGVSQPAMENAVFSLATRFSLFGDRIRVEAEAAGSFYTRDLSAPEEPDGALVSVIRPFLRPRTSTQASWAMRSSIEYTLRDFRVGVRYDRIEPDYQSMGVGYITPDREEIACTASLRFSRAFRFSGSAGLGRNNLLNDRIVTYRRFLWSANGSYQSDGGFGLDARYANHSVSTGDGRVSATDSTRVENVSQSFSVGPRYAFGPAGAQQVVSVLFLFQDYSDRNVYSGVGRDHRTLSATAGYDGHLGEFRLTGSAAHILTRTGAADSRSTSITVGVSRRFFDQALTLSARASCSLIRTSSISETRYLPSLEAQYRLSERDAFSITSQLSHSAGNGGPHTEVITNAAYSRTF